MKIFYVICFIIINFNNPVYSQWTLDLNSNIEYRYVDVLDSSHVFVTGSKSLSYVGKRSINGTWDSLSTNGLNPDKFTVCIAAKDENNIWVGDGIGVNTGADIYRTTNGGQNWSVQINSGGSSDFINGIQFSRVNSSYGYAWSSPANNTVDPIKIFKTSNSGVTWTEYSYTPPQFYTGYRPSICITDSNHAWFNLNKSEGIFDTVKILYTTDGGQNFKISKLPVLGYWAGGLQFKNDNLFGLATVYFQTNILFRSTNGGLNWQILSTPYPLGNTIKIISIPNSRTWYAATDIMDTLMGRLFYKSTNDGSTWFPMSYQYFDKTQISYMDGIAYGNKVFLYAVTRSGKIYRLSETITTVGVTQSSSQVPFKFSLEQNYPNPFNPVTVINYELRVTGHVTFKVFDIAGKEVAALVNEKQNAGTYIVTFDASNLSSGVYFYRLTTGEFSETKKMILTK